MYSNGIELGIPFIDCGPYCITLEAVDNKFIDLHLEKSITVYSSPRSSTSNPSCLVLLEFD